MTDRERVEEDLARAQRARRLLKAAALIFVCGAAMAAFTLGAVNYLAIEKVSACEEDPSGDRCQRVRRATDQAQSIRDKCKNFWRVGYPCPKPGSPADRRFERRQAVSRAVASPAGAEGGEAQQSPHQKGSQQPGPSGGHQDQGDGGKSAPKRSEPPQEPGAPPGSSPPSSAGAPPPSAGTTSEQPTNALEAVAGTVTNAADEATDDVGETVDETCEHLPPALCTK